LNRTDDDFKSFVNFLNLKNNEILITSEKLHIVLAGISEMTEDIVQQRTLLNNLIENKFNGVVNKGTSNDEIFEKAKKYAETELEKLVEQLRLQNEELSKKQEKISLDFEEHKSKVSGDINQLKNDKSGVSSKLSVKEAENKKLKDKLIEKEIKEEFWKWQKSAYWLLLLGAFLIVCIYLMFSNENWKYNYPYKFIKWIDSCKSSTQVAILITLALSLLTGLGKIVSYSWKRLIDWEEKKKKRAEIKNDVKKNYE
jgi:superfamily II DNA helicase RecQ